MTTVKGEKIVEHGQRMRKPLPKNRLEAISDGVFSVALTLMVVDLAAKVPDLDANWWPTFWPKLLVFLYSFWVVAIFWISDHNELNSLKWLGSEKHRDTKMREFLYANMLFLLSIVLMPFSAALLSENWKIAAHALGRAEADGGIQGFWQMRIPLLVYACNLLLSSFSLQLMWWYIKTERAGDIDVDHRHEFGKTTRRNLIIPCAVGVVVLLGLVSVAFAQWALALVPFGYMVWTILDARRATR